MKIKNSLITGIIMLAFLSPSCKKVKLIEDVPLASEDKLNLSYGDNSLNTLDLYLPEKRTEDTKVAVLIHGGFWSSGDKADITLYVKYLQNNGYAVANMNYRLAKTTENYIHPAQINDIKKAIDFLSSKASEYHISSNKFGLIGASSGAHLALLYTYAYNTDDKVKAAISIAGPSNLTDARNVGTIQKLATTYFLGKTIEQAPALYAETSPINHVSATSKPTLLIHGTEDLIVPYQQSVDLKAKLNSFNVSTELYSVAGAGHQNVINPSNSLEAFGKALAWLNTYVK